MKAFHVRQGDVLLVRCSPDELDTSRATKRANGIVAYGEATGHHHMVAEPETMTVFEMDDPESTDGKKLFLQVSENGISLAGTPGGSLAHLDTQKNQADHAPVHVEPGTYKVIIQKEWAPDRSVDVLD